MVQLNNDPDDLGNVLPTSGGIQTSEAVHDRVRLELPECIVSGKVRAQSGIGESTLRANLVTSNLSSKATERHCSQERLKVNLVFGCRWKQW